LKRIGAVRSTRSPKRSLKVVGSRVRMIVESPGPDRTGVAASAADRALDAAFITAISTFER